MVFRGFYQHALQIHSISLSFGYRTPSKSFFTEMVFSRPLHPQLWQLFICNFTLLLIRKVLYNYIHFLLYYYLKTLINSKLSSFFKHAYIIKSTKLHHKHTAQICKLSLSLGSLYVLQRAAVFLQGTEVILYCYCGP